MVVVRVVACLLLLAGFSLQVDVKSSKEEGKAGNFMEDEQWLSTVSQYSRKIKHWNRFRDVSGVFLLCFFVFYTRIDASFICRDAAFRGSARAVFSGDFAHSLTVALKCTYTQP